MGLKRVFGYAARRSSGCEGFLRPRNGSQKDPKWVFSGSLSGLFLFRASHPIRVRRNARKRQRPAFDGAPPTKANGDRVASTRPAGAALRSRRRSMCLSPKPTPFITQMSCLRSVYRIPAGIRPCCAVPPASQCRFRIWLLRYGETNAKSALSVDVRV